MSFSTASLGCWVRWMGAGAFSISWNDLELAVSTVCLLI